MVEGMNCLALIQNMLPSLTKKNVVIANYILENSEHVTNMTTAALAKEISVAESSIIRFCYILGYSGFTNFKINLAKSLKNEDMIVLDDLVIDKKNLEHTTVMKQIFSSVSSVLNETLKIISPKDLSDVIECLSKARRFEFYGVGTSSTIANDAYYRFMRIGLPAQACTDPHIMMISANMLDSDCVAFGISHTGQTSDTIKALEIAKEKGAATICLTSYMNSPITKYSDIKLVTSTLQDIGSNEAIASRIAHIALLDTIYTCIALQNYDSTREHIDSMHEILANMRRR